ncbi:phosphate-starvation-inducible PsiE family protein [Chroococcidiopsis sp. SAG 2025]|uniref:phosphate-starvation-inducible PsiE family protein n=1 Tax=Chroococcidiopsis sp. SAG 2025 TaxID=171389 RepID=UPI0029373688|nr:phosphate-starvation-inducible PsiE family protein [Chroococcidiopsis sp. SAG 2025]
MEYRFKMQLGNWFQIEKIIRNLESIQNFIVVSLCFGLFCVMIIRLGDMFVSLLHPLEFQRVTSDILFILILVELFRLLIIYLQQQRISVGVAVEVSIVSALREIILRGVLEISSSQMIGVCSFLTVLGLLLLVRAWMSRIYDRPMSSPVESAKPEK